MDTGGEPEEGFQAPGVESFDLPPLYPGAPEWLDKYTLMAFVSVILVAAFWMIMARKNKLVPTKGQFVGETAYFFIRNSIARDMIGHDFRKYLPFLIALFSFILVNNLWGVFPLTLLPTAAQRGLGVRVGLDVLGPLQRGGHRQTRPAGLPQARHAAGGRAEGHVADHHPAWSSSPTSSSGR